MSFSNYQQDQVIEAGLLKSVLNGHLENLRSY